MRFVIACLIALGFAVGSAAVALPAAAADSSFVVALQQAPTGELNVDIDTDGGGGAWYTSPLWIAIGAIALLLLIVIVAMAARGGGTTVIRD